LNIINAYLTEKGVTCHVNNEIFHKGGLIWWEKMVNDVFW